MNTLDNVHGHAVLDLLTEAALTRPQLDAELTRRFGAEARFCTCSAQDMTRDELLGLLLQKGKIIEADGLLKTDQSRVCNHG
ncbi:MAG TPA: YecH family metal-binding protein [Phycisphaerae bacterium]|jgi:probable metal-binding protein|nr:YecH family metal-binding protein [Phycisphaerae bacterium]